MPNAKRKPDRRINRTATDLSRPLVVDNLDEEMATYRDRRHALLKEHEGKFVLIKGSNVLGVFSDRSAALREGYSRLGIVPFLVRQVAASDPVVYLPNVVP